MEVAALVLRWKTDSELPRVLSRIVRALNITAQSFDDFRIMISERQRDQLTASNFKARVDEFLIAVQRHQLTLCLDAVQGFEEGLLPNMFLNWKHIIFIVIADINDLVCTCHRHVAGRIVVVSMTELKMMAKTKVARVLMINIRDA
ncbi:hypothetical protein HG530_009620 [Fusarium avenaceum]|nr:hypothetical protein HG530_009620 [Fusarium avenaceum]